MTVTAGRVPGPVLGKQGVAKQLSGIVRYRLPAKRRFKRLRKLTAIPNGTEIDARKGRLLVTVPHDASGRLDGARFYAGRFVFRQASGRTPITTLKLTGGSFENCAAATVRGTKWLTLDRCDGTKVRVVRGKVSVRDLVRPNQRPKRVEAGGKAFIPKAGGRR